MATCKKCGNKGMFLKLNKMGLCKDCSEILIKEITDNFSVSIGMEKYIGTSTGDITNKDYYVYAWKIKETGEVFYVGKGRGNRA